MKISNLHCGNLTHTPITNRGLMRDIVCSAGDLLAETVKGERSIYTGAITGIVGATVGLAGSNTSAPKSLIGGLSALLVALGMGCVIKGTYFGANQNIETSVPEVLSTGDLSSNENPDPDSEMPKRKSA